MLGLIETPHIINYSKAIWITKGQHFSLTASKCFYARVKVYNDPFSTTLNYKICEHSHAYRHV